MYVDLLAHSLPNIEMSCLSQFTVSDIKYCIQLLYDMCL